MRTRWRTAFLVTGAVLMTVGFMLPSGMAFVLGMPILLFAVPAGPGASHCQAAAQLAKACWRG
jgi:hypothetical protein